MLTIGSRCWLCQQPLYISSHGLCNLCVKHLPSTPRCCPRCGLPSASVKQPCGRCLYQPPPWQSLVFASAYQPPLSTLLLRFKSAGTLELALPLARLLLQKLLTGRRESGLIRPQVLLSVPLHRRRYCQRGYNQTELLAHLLAHWIGCAYWPDALERTRAAAPQQSLRKEQRKSNLRRAFRCTRTFAGKHIALLDDVVTTGSTIREISNLLNQQQIASLQVWCLCRTL